VVFEGAVGADQGHQGPADGSDVAVVTGLCHQRQRRQGFLAFARGQGVFDRRELAQRRHRLTDGDRAA
jgi:hypothetical protein